MNDFSAKFGEWIREGFDLYKDNFAVLALASLIACVLSGVTFGILAGPMFAGMILITLRLYDREEPRPVGSEVFQGFRYFLQSLLYFIVWGGIVIVASLILAFIPCLGQILTICLSLAAGAFLMFGLFLIVDREMDFWPASMESINVVKANFLPLLGLSVVAGIIGQIGAIACGVGAILTLPIYFCIVAAVYRDIFGNGGSLAAQTPTAGPTQPEGDESPTSGGEPPSDGGEAQPGQG